ncbi:hypothetical protein EMIT0P218_210038 [Pseudomonas sp. IT-P218]
MKYAFTRWHLCFRRMYLERYFIVCFMLAHYAAPF